MKRYFSNLTQINRKYNKIKKIVHKKIDIMDEKEIEGLTYKELKQKASELVNQAILEY